MSIHDKIVSTTNLNNAHVINNVTWATVVKKKTKKIYRGKGHAPCTWEQEAEKNNHFPKLGNKNSSKKSKKKSEQVTVQADENKISEMPNNVITTNKFAQITPNVRETCGGYNTQSNDIIERRIKERQSLNAENSISDDSFVTASSNESFKTANQDSFNKLQAFQESVNQKILEEVNLDRYKKNALIVNLLKNIKLTENDFDDCDSYYDAYDEGEIEIPKEEIDHQEQQSNVQKDEENVAGCIDNEKPIRTEVVVGGCDEEDDNIVLDYHNNDGDDDEIVLQGERIGRLFQSEEDADVYVHPLKERIKKDAAWKEQTLERKGKETVYSPRQYFLSLSDDIFDFDQPQVNKTV